MWAEPSVEQAAELMRFVVDHPDEARVRGAARETIQRDYSETRIAEMVRQRLAIIGERHQFDEFKQDVKALVAAYRDLVRDIRDVVGRVVPAGGGNVMVVSKGDNNLLQFEGRTGFHFPETGTGVYAGYHPATALPRSRRWTRNRPGARVLLFLVRRCGGSITTTGSARISTRAIRDCGRIGSACSTTCAMALRRCSDEHGLGGERDRDKVRNGGNARRPELGSRTPDNSACRRITSSRSPRGTASTTAARQCPSESANVAYFEHVMREAGLTQASALICDGGPQTGVAIARCWTSRKRRTCC